MDEKGDKLPTPDYVFSSPAPDSSPSAARKRRKPLETLLVLPRTQKERQDLDHRMIGAEASVVERVKDVPVNLVTEFPSFMKTMVRSNVTTGFWLHLPMQFCKMHMPKHNATITLEDENREEYKVNYIVEKSGISGGWKVFTHAHNLCEGDVLTFQLVKPSKFKVYIERANRLSESDGTLDHPDVEGTSERFVSEEDRKEKLIKQHRKPNYLEATPLNFFPKCIQMNVPIVEHGNVGVSAYHAESERKELKCCRVSESVLDLNKIKSSDDFIIVVNGTVIDSELSDYHKAKYFELCCSQKSYLHNGLLKNLNCKLAGEVIIETINLADAIRSCSFSTLQDNYGIWDKTLDGFEMLGMKVGFLRARLNRLLSHYLETEKYEDAKKKQVRIEEEMKATESKLLKLKREKERLDVETNMLKGKAQRCELLFLEQANAPW